MSYTEACPKCNSEDYENDGYGSEFDQFGCEQWWGCTCSKCGCKFVITKTYKLVGISIEEGELV